MSSLKIGAVFQSFLLTLHLGQHALYELFIKSEEMRLKEIEEKTEDARVRTFNRFAPDHRRRHRSHIQGPQSVIPCHTGKGHTATLPSIWTSTFTYFPPFSLHQNIVAAYEHSFPPTALMGILVSENICEKAEPSRGRKEQLMGSLRWTV